MVSVPLLCIHNPAHLDSSNDDRIETGIDQSLASSRFETSRNPSISALTANVVLKEPIPEQPNSKARPTTPEAKPVRVTRRQLALAEAAPTQAATIEEPVIDSPEPQLEPVASVEEDILAVEAVEELATPAEAPSTILLELKVADEALPAVESPAASSNASLPAEIPTEHPIDALDALEDTLDEVDKIIPGFDLPSSSVQPRPTRSTATKPKTSEPRAIKAPSPSALKKEPAAKKPLARSGSVKTKAAPKIATTTQPSATSRLRTPAAVASSNGTSSLARSNSAKTTNPLTKSTSTLGRSASTRARPTSMIVPKAADTKKPDYLAVKRRPISVQFPTPPPAPKSTKPTTQATFKLPGEEIAAKLKQAKEERLKRMEAKEAEKKEAKPRPTIRKPIDTKPAATKSRLSTGGVEPVKDKENVPSGGLKRSSTVTGSSTKRTSMIPDRTKRTSMIGGAPGTSVSIPPLKRSSVAAENGQKAFSSSLSMSKQRTTTASTTLPAANTSAKRLSTMASSTSLGSKSRNVSGATDSTAANKGKDESMKKARADAAERGRQASRDWAEKEKQKKAAAARRGSAEAVAV